MIGDNRLPALAGEIQAAHDRCRASVQEYAKASVKAGRALLEAKGLVPHGQWQDWLRANLHGVGIRSAQRYMKAAENAGENDTVTFSTLRELLRPDRPRAIERNVEPDEEPGLRFGAGIVPHVAPAGCSHPFQALTWTHLPGTSEAVCGGCGKAVRIEYGPPVGLVVHGILLTQAERIDPPFYKRALARLSPGHTATEAELALRAEATAVICNRVDSVFHYIPGAGRSDLLAEDDWDLPSLWRSHLWCEFGSAGFGRRRKPSAAGAQP